jgi:transposase
MSAARRGKRAKAPAVPETRRVFSPEYKREAVRLAVGDRSVRAVALALGVRPDMLYQWRRQAEARVQQPVADVFTGSGTMMSQDEEIRRLRRENATLREERDVLGKATAFFAKYAR